MAPTLFNLDRMVASYGVPPADLRRYERLGLLQPVAISGNPHYSPRDRVRLEIVVKGLGLGFSLAEITTMILGTLAVSATKVRTDGFDRDRVVAELRTLLARQGGPHVSVEDLKSLLRRSDG